MTLRLICLLILFSYTLSGNIKFFIDSTVDEVDKIMEYFSKNTLPSIPKDVVEKVGTVCISEISNAVFVREKSETKEIWTTISKLNSKYNDDKAELQQKIIHLQSECNQTVAREVTKVAQEAVFYVDVYVVITVILVLYATGATYYAFSYKQKIDKILHSMKNA